MPALATPTKLAAVAAGFAVLYLALAPLGVWTADGLYSLVVLVAATMCVKVLLAPGAAHRRFWLAFAPGVILMGAGDLLWTAFELLGADPTPSPADGCYVLGELLIVFALLRGSRTWSPLRSVRTLIDGSVLAAAALTIAGSLIVAPQLGGELDTTILLALAYSGLGVIAVVPALILCLGRPPLPILLVAAGLVSSTLGDGLYTWLEARGAYVSGHRVDLFWLAEYGLYAVAAAISIRPARRLPARPVDGDAGLVPLLGGVVALFAFWLLQDRPLSIGVVLAGALAAMAVRLLITSRDHRRIARELATALAERERAWVTDTLTGLRNRAAIEEALRARHALGVVTLELETAALSFADRDDVVLAAAGRIRALVGAGAVLGRTGASELTLLVGNPAATRATAERMRAAIAGEPFPAGAVGASAGVAWAPAHGATGEALLRAAEQARALARELGGNQVRAHGDTVDRALLEELADDVDLRRGCEGHSRAVGRWAAAVAAQLGLDADAQHRCELAGRLHDIRLVRAPDALLRRPQLTTRDDLVRLEEHPLAGAPLAPAVERALGDVAPGIACHHDMLDAAPPLEARIVAVCNAWASLREGRAGRVPLGVEAARAQLRTRSGTAYDPDVVRAFLQLELSGEVGRNEASDLRPARGHVAADEILVATAAAAETPATPGVAAPAGATPRRATRLLAAALIVLAGWSAWTTTLHVDVAREDERKDELVEADRALHELQRLRASNQAGTPAAQRYREQLSAVTAQNAESPVLQTAARSLHRTGELLDAAAARGDATTAALLSVHIGAKLVTIDAQLNAEIERARAIAEGNDAHAWRITAGSGAVAALVAGLLLTGFARRRRAAERQRTSAAREAGERAALLDSERRFRALVQHASDSVLVLDETGTITFVTDAIEALLGRPAAELHGRRFEELVDPVHRGRLEDLLVAARRMPDAAQGHLLLRHAAGHAVDADLRVADRVDDPDVAGIVLTLRDLSEQRVLETELRQSALVDARTGLANRARFERWLHDALGRDAHVAVVLIDLDDFKTINDSLGHPAGDRVLAAYAERLREAVGESGRIARLGSDEFAVLFEDVTDPESAEALARRLTEAVAGAVRLDGTEVPLTASAGVSLSSPGDLSEDVVRAADTAAHAAKARGAGHVVVYSPSMHANAVRRLGLRSALARAVEREELELAYQPIIDTETGETTGLETLLRWRTAEGEPVSPADFIPVAEASGLIVPLGAWVLERACADAAALEDLVVGVNVSAVQLRAPDFVGTVAGALARSGLPAERLVLELTESALVDDIAGVREIFDAVRALGVAIAIDDFGTGFSSLATLADFPVDVLKLDRSFVHAMTDSPGHEALVGGVVSLAERLGLPIVAEGVETEEQYEALRGLGCRWAQGYHLGRPAPLAALELGSAAPVRR